MSPAVKKPEESTQSGYDLYAGMWVGLQWDVSNTHMISFVDQPATALRTCCLHYRRGTLALALPLSLLTILLCPLSDRIILLVIIVVNDTIVLINRL
jgi:hypothetical protein